MTIGVVNSKKTADYNYLSAALNSFLEKGIDKVITSKSQKNYKQIIQLAKERGVEYELLPSLDTNTDMKTFISDTLEISKMSEFLIMITGKVSCLESITNSDHKDSHLHFIL